MKLFDFEKVTRISNTFKYFYINIMVLVSYYDGNEFNYFYYVQARKMKARGGGAGVHQWWNCSWAQSSSVYLFFLNENGRGDRKYFFLQFFFYPS